MSAKQAPANGAALFGKGGMKTRANFSEYGKSNRALIIGPVLHQNDYSEGAMFMPMQGAAELAAKAGLASEYSEFRAEGLGENFQKAQGRLAGAERKEAASHANE